MLEFITIVNKLKKLTDKKRDIEIATLLKADSAKFAQWKKRNTIPIQELVSYSIENDVDMNYLLKNDVELNGDSNSNSQIKNIFDDEFLKAYGNLNDKKKQYFYHIIMAENCKEE